jgi:hypothetical protein
MSNPPGATTIEVMIMFMLVLGAGICLLVRKAVRRSGRSRWLSTWYGLLTASLPGIGYGVVMGNRIDEMGAIPYLVLAGALIQFMLLPALVAIVVLEVQRFRAGATPPPE